MLQPSRLNHSQSSGLAKSPQIPLASRKSYGSKLYSVLPFCYRDVWRSLVDLPSVKKMMLPILAC